jgi:sulfide:quinone oxidoreductase
VFAHAQGEVVARNIASVIRGEAGADHFNGYGECFVESGGGKAGFGGGNFYAEPVPLIRLRAPSRRWHLAKVLFEKSWLRFKL